MKLCFDKAAEPEKARVCTLATLIIIYVCIFSPHWSQQAKYRPYRPNRPNRCVPVSKLSRVNPATSRPPRPRQTRGQGRNGKESCPSSLRVDEATFRGVCLLASPVCNSSRATRCSKALPTVQGACRVVGKLRLGGRGRNEGISISVYDAISLATC
jgi:hypothetical protein